MYETLKSDSIFNIKSLDRKKIDNQSMAIEPEQEVLNFAESHGVIELTIFLKKQYTTIFTGIHEQMPVILKVGTSLQEINQEVSALKYFKKQTQKLVPMIIAYHDQMIIMERIMPGISLDDQFHIDDIEATNLFCKLVQKLHRPFEGEPSLFKSLSAICSDLDTNNNQIPELYLKKARILRDHLLSTTTQLVLLHGDLHHDNMVKSDTGWVIIDPKGIIGDPAYEFAQFIFNPLPDLLDHPDAEKIMRVKIALCSKIFDISEERILAWCYVKAVLCCIWSLDCTDQVLRACWNRLPLLFDRMQKVGE